MMRRFVLTIGAVLFGAVLAAATPLRAETLLTLTNTTLTAAPTSIELDLAALEKLPQHKIVTHNEFVDGAPEFVGPLAREVVAMIGAGTAKTARLVAANDYAVEIDLAEFQKYDVILALKQDGQPLSRRDKGPIWVIYPMDDHAELRDPSFNNRLIWQLVRLELQ